MDKTREYVLKTIMAEMPPEVQLTRIEFEGPEIAIYVKNRKAIADKLDLVKAIAKKVKKRVVVRIDPEARMPPEEAREKILELIPRDAGIDPKSMVFDKTLGEVWIKAEKPGLVIGKGATLRHLIMAETGWRPVPVLSLIHI